MVHIRKWREIETQIQTLETNYAAQPSNPTGQAEIEEAIYHRDIVTAQAEKEALASARCYRSFGQKVEAAHNAYDILNLALTGKPLNPIIASPGEDRQLRLRSARSAHPEEAN